MFKEKKDSKISYGITSLGERGQVVIPVDIRNKMGLKAGDKLVTFLKHGKVLVMIKAEEMAGLIEKMTKKFENLKKVIKK